jgi:hypothetical protein
VGSIPASRTRISGKTKDLNSLLLRSFFFGRPQVTARGLVCPAALIAALFGLHRSTWRDCAALAIRQGAVIINPVAAVAQLDRVLGYEPRGRGFNSCQPHQNSCFEMKDLSGSRCLGLFFMVRDFLRGPSPQQLKSLAHAIPA